METQMKLKVTYANGNVRVYNINPNCTTEQLIAKIEKHEYNPIVKNVKLLWILIGKWKRTKKLWI